MKHILKSKMLWAAIVILSLLPITHLSAQDLKVSGFTAGDVNLYFNPDDSHHSIEVELYSSDPATRIAPCEFHWEVLESPNNSPEDYLMGYENFAKPSFLCFAVGTYVVQATRVSKYGYQTEMCIVNLTSEISLESAKDNKGCWEHGENITPADFDFTTSPPGYEQYVQVVETRVQDQWYGNTEIHFQVKDPQSGELADSDVTEEIFVNVGVITSTNEIAALRDVAANWPYFKRYYEEFKMLTKEIKGVGNKAKEFEKLTKLAQGFSKGLPIKSKCKSEVNLNVDIGTTCCQRMGQSEKEPVIYADVTGTIEVGAGFKAYFPLWPPVPKLGINITMGAYAGIESKTGFKIAKFVECNQVYMDFAVKGEINVGLAFVFLDPDVITLGAEGYGTAHGHLLFKSDAPYCEFKEFKGSIGIRVYGTVLGLNKVIYNYQSKDIPLF